MNSSKEFLYLSNDHSKVRLVFDQYIKRSLKSRTRQHLISRKQVQYKVTNSTDINNTTFKQFLSHSDTKHQCKTVRQGIVRYRFVHFSALFLYIFLHIFLLSLFSCRIFFTLHVSRVARFLCCTLVKLHCFILQVSRDALFSCCTNSMLHFFSWYTLFMLQFFRVLFFFVLLHVALFCCCSLFGLHFSMLHFLRLILFSCCTFFRVASC